MFGAKSPTVGTTRLLSAVNTYSVTEPFLQLTVLVHREDTSKSETLLKTGCRWSRGSGGLDPGGGVVTAGVGWPRCLAREAKQFS